VQFVHALAPAADQVLVAKQLPQTALDVAEQAAERYLPAAQPDGKEQLVHGSYPEADQEVPATQVGAATHLLDKASHTKAGPLQAQLVWFVFVLLTLYSSVVGQSMHEPS